MLSERCDWYSDPDTGVIRARHQEEFCQALFWTGSLKYDAGLAHEPHFERASAPKHWECHAEACGEDRAAPRRRTDYRLRGLPPTMNPAPRR